MYIYLFEVFFFFIHVHGTKLMKSHKTMHYSVTCIPNILRNFRHEVFRKPFSGARMFWHLVFTDWRRMLLVLASLHDWCKIYICTYMYLAISWICLKHWILYTIRICNNISNIHMWYITLSGACRCYYKQ
jgi:hypothetical protein